MLSFPRRERERGWGGEESKRQDGGRQRENRRKSEMREWICWTWGLRPRRVELKWKTNRATRQIHTHRRTATLAYLWVYSRRSRTHTHSLQGITLKCHVVRYPSCINLCCPKNLGHPRSIRTQFGKTKYQVPTHSHSHLHTGQKSIGRKRMAKSGHNQIQRFSHLVLGRP